MSTRIDLNYEGISREQFASFPEFYDPKQALSINVRLNFIYQVDRRLVACQATATFSSEDHPYIRCALTCAFTVSPDSWNERMNTEQDVVELEASIYEHLGAFTVGSLRGYLHAKQMESPIRVVLPPVNVTEIVQQIENKTIPLSAKG